MSQTVLKLAPLFNRVLIKRTDPVTHSRGGIVLPNDTKNKVLTGTVVAVGPGVRNSEGETIPCCIQPGDEVLLPDYGGTRVEVGADRKEELFMFREPDILAKLKE